MMSEPSGTVAKRTRKLEDSKVSKLDDRNAPDKILPWLFTKHQTGIIREHWRSRHRQHATILVFSPPSWMSRIKSSMYIPGQDVYLYFTPADEDIFDMKRDYNIQSCTGAPNKSSSSK